MVNTNGCVEEVKIAYIGGGSRNWARNFICDLALEPALAGEIALFDIDRQAAADNAVIGNSLIGRPDAPGKWNYTVAETPKQALRNSDFVVISILPGTFREMEADVHAPEAYGIYQPVGDTTGPGGAVRAARTLPIFEYYGRLIRDLCPRAWVINYTNPLAVCVRTLYRVFPEIRAFGCCHGIFSTQQLLAWALRDLRGIDHVPREEIDVNVLGINHFTWIDRASWRGMDLFPIYGELAERYADTGYYPEPERDYQNDCFADGSRVQFDLFRRYGIMSTVGDRHAAEFFPAAWYLRDPETVARWNFALTPVSWRIRDMEQKIRQTRELAEGRKRFALKATGEEGVKLIKALAGLGTMISNVNLPNRGQLEGIPKGAVVETNAVFRGGRAEPVQAGRLPDAVQAMVLRHVYNQEAIVNGILNRDRAELFKAFVNDPLCGGLSLQEAETLFAQMLSATRTYLPAEWQ